jgi:hypothetical protein
MSMTTPRDRAVIDLRAARYVASIRTKAKREHASRYLAFLRRERNEPPQRNESLSLMAAQAVEMRLRTIWTGGE